MLDHLASSFIYKEQNESSPFSVFDESYGNKEIDSCRDFTFEKYFYDFEQIQRN